MVLPLTSGEEGYCDEEGACCGEGQGLQTGQASPDTLLLLFVDRHEVTNGLPDLFAVLGVSRWRRDGFDGGEVVAERSVGFGALAAVAQVMVDARWLRGLAIVMFDELFFR